MSGGHRPELPVLRRLLDAACAAERDLAWVENERDLAPARRLSRDRALARLDSALRHLHRSGQVDAAGYRALLARSLMALARERRMARGTPLVDEEEQGFWHRRSDRDRALIRAWRWARLRAAVLSLLARWRR